MSDEILKQMVDELAAIRELLSKVLGAQQETQGVCDTKAEIDMVESMGLDFVIYLKDKCRKNRANNKQTQCGAASHRKQSNGAKT